MNPIIETILNRRSVRSYQERDIPPDIKAEIIHATLRAPTAGNMMLYSIVEVTDQAAKDALAKSCDNQPFIAEAPWVLLFVADYQRWYDYYLASGVLEQCAQQGVSMRKPEEGDLMLACCDALIAAQTTVLAAESFGLGSCYIGDIMEQYETHRDLFDLPQYVFPICLLCLGYPTPQQKEREQTTRYDRKFIVFENKYRRLGLDDFRAMYRDLHARNFKEPQVIEEAVKIGQLNYQRKFSAAFSIEMSRSVRAILQRWKE